MRLHFGGIPEVPDFYPEDGWTPLREPSPWAMQFLATPIGIGLGILFVYLWANVTESPFEVNPLAVMASFVLIIPIHELLHAIIHPHYGRTNESVIGLWPSKLLFYAAFTGVLSRNRFLAILVTPLVVISVVPLAVAAVTSIKMPFMATTSTLNALLACGDVFAIGLVWWQVPGTARVRNQGWRTYWRH